MTQLELPFDDDLSEEASVDTEQLKQKLKTQPHDPALESVHGVPLDRWGFRGVHPYVAARDKYMTSKIDPATRKVVLRVLSELVGAHGYFLSRDELASRAPRIADFLDDFDRPERIKYLYATLKRRAGDYGYALLAVKQDGACGYQLADLVAQDLAEYISADSQAQYSYAVYQALVRTDIVPEQNKPGLVSQTPDVETVQQLACAAVSEGLLDMSSTEVTGIEPASDYVRTDEALDKAAEAVSGNMGHKSVEPLIVPDAVYDKMEDECSEHVDKLELDKCGMLQSRSATVSITYKPDGATEYVRTDEAVDKAASALQAADDVNSPSHYQCPFMLLAPECGFFTAGMDFFAGNAFKYIWRAGRKGDWRKAVQDIDKAMKYMSMAAEHPYEWWGSSAQREACVVWRTLMVEPERADDLSSEIEYLRFRALSCIMRDLEHNSGYEWYDAEDLKSILLNMRAVIADHAINS